MVSAPPRIRQSARALLVDHDHRVLLVQFAFPASLDAAPHEPKRRVWATPGGGIEAGETAEDTLRRELHEELGLQIDSIGPLVWTRTFLVPFLDGSFDGQEDAFFFMRTSSFEPEPAIGWDRLRAEYVAELRWWTVAELRSAHPSTRFAPRRLPQLLPALLADGPPPWPIDVGE